MVLPRLMLDNREYNVLELNGIAKTLMTTYRGLVIGRESYPFSVKMPQRYNDGCSVNVMFCIIGDNENVLDNEVFCVCICSNSNGDTDSTIMPYRVHIGKDTSSVTLADIMGICGEIAISKVPMVGVLMGDGLEESGDVDLDKASVVVRDSIEYYNRGRTINKIVSPRWDRVWSIPRNKRDLEKSMAEIDNLTHLMVALNEYTHSVVPSTLQVGSEYNKVFGEYLVRRGVYVWYKCYFTTAKKHVGHFAELMSKDKQNHIQLSMNI